MSKKYAVIFLIVLCSLFGSSNSYAQVVINEYYPNPPGPSSELDEFIELYNLGQDPVDLNLYTLEDKIGKRFTINSFVLNPKTFKSFTKSETSLALNNSDESIALKKPDGTVVDSVSYDRTVEGKSVSRVPDGNGDFRENSIPSPNSANNWEPSITPYPTSSPSDTPIPTSIPTEADKITSLPTQKIEDLEPSDFEKSTVLGYINQDTVKVIPTDKNLLESSSDKEEKMSTSMNIVPIIFIIFGLVFIIISTYLFFIKLKNSDTINTAFKNENQN